MTKAGIDHLTRCLAYEWAPHQVTVNAVAPTFIWTDGTRPALADENFLRDTLAQIPLGRIGEPMDVAGAVVFLASPAASLITGTMLRVDGGWALACTISGGAREKSHTGNSSAVSRSAMLSSTRSACKLSTSRRLTPVSTPMARPAPAARAMSRS